MNESIAKFVAEANDFCLLIEDPSEADQQEFALTCLGTLVRLFDRALALPLAEPVAPDHSNRITLERWEAIRQSVGEKLERDYYWMIFDPMAALEGSPPEPLLGSLSDDLADIWRDLKEGLEVLTDRTGVRRGERYLALAFLLRITLGPPRPIRHHCSRRLAA